MRELIDYVEQSQLKKKIPKVKPGFIVAVHQKIKEGKKERIQVFKGIVIKVKGGYGVNGSFTVRRVASGVGVEKTFLFNSPTIEKIVVLKQAKVRRSKLYYLRGRFGKAAKLNLLGEDKEVESLIREVAGDDQKSDDGSVSDAKDRDDKAAPKDEKKKDEKAQVGKEEDVKDDSKKSDKEEDKTAEVKKEEVKETSKEENKKEEKDAAEVKPVSAEGSDEAKKEEDKSKEPKETKEEKKYK